MEIINSKLIRKAKKEYKCDWCELPIEIKELHEVTVLKDDGVIYTWRNHIRCDEIANKLDMFYFCEDGLSSNSFKEYITDEYRFLTKSKELPVFEIQLNEVFKHYLTTIINADRAASTLNKCDTVTALFAFI